MSGIIKLGWFFASGLRRSKWAVLRLGIAVSLLVVCIREMPSALARLQLHAMPDFDYVAEVDRLRGEGRYGEAIMVADAGADELTGAELQRLNESRDRVIEERDSIVRRVKEAGLGALVGSGNSLEALAGAVAADMFVVGDVRDLVIQGGRYAADGDTDEIVLALSAVGIATTVAPQIDWAASLLKIGRKTGAMGRRLGETVLQICRDAARGKDLIRLERLAGDTISLSKRLSPGGFLRLLRHADDPGDIAKLARFTGRHPHGAFALHVGGADAARHIARAAQPAAEVLVLAAKKGDRGLAWFRSSGRTLFRPHLLVGVAKGLQKGNAGRLIEQVAVRLDSNLWLIIPALLGWSLFEVALIRRSFGQRPASAIDTAAVLRYE